MNAPNPDLRQTIDDIADALQSALLLAGKLATNLRTEAHDAGQVYEAIARATDAVRRLRSAGGAS